MSRLMCASAIQAALLSRRHYTEWQRMAMHLHYIYTITRWPLKPMETSGGSGTFCTECTYVSTYIYMYIRIYLLFYACDRQQGTNVCRLLPWNAAVERICYSTCDCPVSELLLRGHYAHSLDYLSRTFAVDAAYVIAARSGHTVFL
jgi:hypothetical protein